MNQLDQQRIVKRRLLSIDILRGLIIVFMALDHTRDSFGANFFHPTDLSHTDAAWFFSRWITHFCAPLFVFLTGLSAYLYYQKTQSLTQLRYFLVTRGLWMVFVELVIVNLSWQLTLNYTFLQVIWVLGWSMLILAGLSYFSLRTILLLSLPVVLLHNALDDKGIMAALGDYSLWWNLLHFRGGFELFDGGWFVYVIYPLIPWPAVMALGFVVGNWYIADEQLRIKKLLSWGIGCWLLFLLLRYTGWYGDSRVWPVDEHFGHPVLSFFDTEKYPPSLQFLLMTIGPGLILLAVLDKLTEHDRAYFWLHPMRVFGSVPMFFYLLHAPVIVFSSMIYSHFAYGKAVVFFYGPSVFPEGYQPSLFKAYVAWGFIVTFLYIPCRSYAKLKSRSNHPIFSYI